MNGFGAFNCMFVLGVSLALLGGCATRAPTVAHVHVGHAITAAHDTPGREGYFVVAEQRALEALEAAEAAAQATTLDARKAAITEVNEATNSREDFALVDAVMEAARHIEFAATSSDASNNVKQSSGPFSERTEGIVYRGNLIKLYAADALASQSMSELGPLSVEVLRLARANVYGDPAESGNRRYGTQQLRTELDEMVARENPPYATVGRWYLFNLIRLPNGVWGFRSGNRGGEVSY